MKSIVVRGLLVFLNWMAPAGPAVARMESSSERADRWRLEAELADCEARIAASPEWQALQTFLTEPPDRKATPSEGRLMTRLHHEYLRPCQEIDLEIAGRTHPSLPPLYNAGVAQADVEIGRLLRQEITWAEYGRRSIAIRKSLNVQLEATRRTLGLSSLNRLDRVRTD